MLRIVLLVLTFAIWLPIAFLVQIMVRPAVLCFMQVVKNMHNTLKFILIVVLGVICFPIIQVMFVFYSFIQIPRNIAAAIKILEVKHMYIRLLWEDSNNIEQTIDNYLDEIKIGQQSDYEMVSIHEREV